MRSFSMLGNTICSTCGLSPDLKTSQIVHGTIDNGVSSKSTIKGGIGLTVPFHFPHISCQGSLSLESDRLYISTEIHGRCNFDQRFALLAEHKEEMFGVIVNTFLDDH